MKLCPACATELPDDARHCGRCRAVQPAVVPAAAAAAPPDATDGDADGFADEATRANPEAISKALSMMRHPTGVVSGVNRDDVEAEIRRATREVEQARNLGAAGAAPALAPAEPAGDAGDAGGDADDFEGGATMVDPELVARLSAQAAAHEPRSGPRKAPMSMMPVDPPVPRPLRPTAPSPVSEALGPTEPWMPAAKVPLPPDPAPPAGDDRPASAAPAPEPRDTGDAAAASTDGVEDGEGAAPVRFPIGMAVAAALVTMVVATVVLMLVTGRIP